MIPSLPLNVGKSAVAVSTVMVVGGSAVLPVMAVPIPQFERTSGHKVLADFDAAIGAVAMRIEAGERADIVVVSRMQIESLEKAGKVVEGTATDLGIHCIHIIASIRRRTWIKWLSVCALGRTGTSKTKSPHDPKPPYGVLRTGR